MKDTKYADVAKLACSQAYQSCCTRKNCAMTCIWFLISYCHEHEPSIARFSSVGGCYINDMYTFSLLYSMLTNTEKKKPSKSDFGYTCRQNLQNHFLLVHSNNGSYFFHHPHVLPSYRGFPLEKDMVREKLLPWKRSLSKEEQYAIIAQVKASDYY